MKRRASAEWNGNLQTGKGKLTASSGAFNDLPYSFATRFADLPGTNPEELIAAAHSGCFTMAVAFELEKAGYKPDRLHTEAIATLSQENAKWSVSGVHLDLTGNVPGASREEFDRAAKTAKENCPISRLLNTKITLEVKFEPTAVRSNPPETKIA